MPLPGPQPGCGVRGGRDADSANPIPLMHMGRTGAGSGGAGKDGR